MESRKGRRKIPAWFWENICNLWLVIVYFTEIMIQQFFPAPRRGLNLGLQFFPGLKPRAEFYRPCGTVLFADMIFYTYCLFMEIWQNHFLKKQFSSDQIWRKYLFFEKLWDSCEKIMKKNFRQKTVPPEIEIPSYVRYLQILRNDLPLGFKPEKIQTSGI